MKADTPADEGRLPHPPPPGALWSFAVDRGGTFTDVVATSDAGERVVTKLLTSSALYPDATLEAIRRVLAVSAEAPIPVVRLREVRVGTTVATNALIERRGAKAALVTTRGFGDALVIGDQTRRELFALAHAPRRPLYAEVIEADERVGPGGDLLAPLDEPALERALREAQARGIVALAITFLHATANPDHERRAGAIAARVGFTEVALSHLTVAVDRVLPRASTTVADAATVAFAGMPAHVSDTPDAVAIGSASGSPGFSVSPMFRL